MADVAIEEIVRTLAERVGSDSADELLAVGLHAAELPIKPLYHPTEVVRLGRAIAEAQRELMLASPSPEVQALAEILGPLLKGAST